MRTDLTFLFFLLIVALTSCFPSISIEEQAQAELNGPGYYDRLENYELNIQLMRPESAGISFEQPSEGLEPSETYYLNLNCKYDKALASDFQKTRILEEDVKRFAQSRGDIALGKRLVKIKDVRVSCQNDKIFIDAGYFKKLQSFLGFSGQANAVDNLDQELSFNTFRGYKYPNLRVGAYSGAIGVVINRGTISSDTYDPARVILLQETKGSKVSAEGVSFDATKPAILVVDRENTNTPIWDVLRFDYDKGTLQWERVDERPY